MNLDFGVIWSNWRLLAEGMQLSLLITLIAIAGGILVGTLLAVMRLSPFRLLNWIAAG
ncbi:MAG: amino acid ABC transporter permease, partial [Proteobacteria bacterium]|nr:amino acid ABC transporter permease [Pseudomonadota bacterium]